MAKTKLRQIEVVKKRSGWVAETKSGRTYATGSTKATVVNNAARKARGSSRPTSLRIHGRDGRIQEERTYPRRVDPQASKG